jgi:3-keto-disaccharide hydrolase
MKRLLAFACALFVAPQLFSQDWIPLQDGKSLAGWKAPERPESWKVEDGVFVTRGDRSHLYYVGKVGKHDFRNFEFSAEVLTEPGSNSGIYIHTKYQPEGWPAAGYEIQVINSNPPAEKMNGYIEHKMTGSIYAVRNTWVAPVKDNEWFSYRIRVVGKTIQTFINDKLICEYAEPQNPWRADDKKGRVLGSGTFGLQAHDPGSVVKYRNMKVKILPNDATPPAGLVPIEDRELDELIGWASDKNIPLIDLALAPPAEGVEDFWSSVRRHGMTTRASLPPAGLRDSGPGSMLIIVDRDKPADVAVLKAAKAAGMRVIFSTAAGSVSTIDEAQLKGRLKAIRDAGLGWKDFWVPGKP